MEQTNSGRYMLFASTRKSTWIIKADPQGDEAWTKIITNPRSGKDLICVDGLLASDGGYAIVGTSGSEGWFVKTDSEGNTK